jgi:two-component system cell cycle response regulator
VIVLVVEDEPDHRELFRQILAHAGARVVLAEDGQVAVRLLEMAPRPDIILCDLLMPELDGIGLARYVAAHPQLRRIPVLAVTALGGAADYIRTWTHGFAGHLVKPVDPDHLVASVRDVTRARTA